MSPELKALIEKYRDYKMTPEERFEQAINFAWGNAAFEYPWVKVEDFRAAALKIWPDGKIPE